MLLILKGELFDSGGRAHQLIDRIVDRVSEEIHRLDLPDADMLVSSSWYSEARQIRKQTLKESAASPPRQALSRGPHHKTFEATDLESLEVCERLAHTPLTILLEDREADGILLEIIVEELGWRDLRRLWERSKSASPRAIELTNAGGIGAIPTRVQRIVEDAKQAGHPPRLFVLCDSDRKWPGHADTIDVVNVRRKCNEHDIPYHILRKRRAENYIPDEVFTSIKASSYEDKQQLCDIYLNLTDVQKDYFKLRGLKELEINEATELGLYENGQKTSLMRLHKLIERSWGNSQPTGRAKRPRPIQLMQHEYRHAFTARGLKTRDGIDELPRLLKAISKEI